jgi:hypothetical protein
MNVLIHWHNVQGKYTTTSTIFFCYAHSEWYESRYLIYWLIFIFVWEASRQPQKKCQESQETQKDNITWLLRQQCVTYFWNLTVPRWTNKWGPPNNRDNHPGRMTSISIAKDRGTYTMRDSRYDNRALASHAARASHPWPGSMYAKCGNDLGI